MKKFLIALMFALGCAGGTNDGTIDDGTADPEGDEVELGAAGSGSMEYGDVQQGLEAQCGTPNFYGVDLRDFQARKCDFNQAATTCHFPHTASAWTIGLGNGFTSNDRVTLSGPGTIAMNTWRSNFPTWQSPTNLWGFSANSGTTANAALPGTIPVGATSAAWSTLVNMACVDSQTLFLPAPAPVGKARACFGWAATIDLAKIKSWTGTGTPYTNAMTNIFQHMYAIMSGAPLSGTNGTITDASISKSAIDTQWYTWSGSGGVRVDSQIKNFKLLQDGTGTLHCYQ